MDVPEPRARGAVVRLIGVVMIALGALDSMLAWRGGLAVTNLYVLLIGAGFLVYALGAAWRGAGRRAGAAGQRAAPPRRIP